MPDISTIGYPKKLNSRPSKLMQEEMARIKGLFTLAQDTRRKREQAWKNSEDRYMGIAWRTDPDDPFADIIVVNLTFSTVATVSPFVTGGDTTFIIEPLSHDSDSVRARYIQVYLNRLWRSSELNAQQRMRKAAFNSSLYGDGYLNVTWDIKTIPTLDPLGNAVPNENPKKYVKFDIKNVSPWDVWIDPQAEDLVDARWYIVRTVMPLSAFKNDARFYNTRDAGPDRSFITSYGQRLHAAEAEAARNGAEDYVAVFDFYDVHARRLVTFTNNSDLPHRWIEEVKRPLVQVPNYTIPNSPYHIGDVEMMASLQDELNKTRSQMITHRRRNTSKVLYRPDALGENALEALQSSTVMQGVEIIGDEPFENVVSVMESSPLGADVYNMSDIIQRDIMEITGVNEYLRGSVPETARTATEASLIEGGSNVKIRDKLRRVEDAAREVGQLLIDIAREAYQATDYEEMTLYLTGREAEQVLRASNQNVYSEQGQALDARVKPTPELFKGRYEVFVERGSTELRNPMFREQKYREMFMVILNAYPMLAQAGVQIDLKKALTMWLEAAGVTDIDGVFMNLPPQDPAINGLMAQFGGQPQQAQPQATAGLFQQQGMPNTNAAVPPSEPITPDTSGMLPPME